MKASQNIKNRIKEWEGCKLSSYKCPAGIWTIGYGHTSGVMPNQHITQAEADEMFDRDIEKFEGQMWQLVSGLRLTQGQYDALLSFAYNVGIGNFKASTLYRKVGRNPNDPTILGEFRKWTKAAGRELPGLVKRRDGEAKIYQS